MNEPKAFYDALAEWYHLIFEDWDRSIGRQGTALASVIDRWPGSRQLILDAASGIGTQTIALALRGFDVIGSDISVNALLRARRESAARATLARWVAADFRALPFRSGCTDIALACDNALPHLLSLPEIRTAISELCRCVRPGGGVLISMRDYVRMPPGTREHRPYGEREWDGRRYFAEQEWEWRDATYTLIMRLRPLGGLTPGPIELRTTYFAIAIEDMLAAMRDAGLNEVERIDDVFYQPLLIGTVPGAA